jgi:23S rRNA (cytidine1920-2'-O)/16S rRNA (cytidine1409-2'-O)-methyltransferase
MRLDQYLVFKNLVKTRSKAKDLIKNQGVLVIDARKSLKKEVFQPSFEITEDNSIEIEFNQDYLAYVSRAGLKLEAASEQLRISFQQKKILDIGVSTGGFSQYALNSKAQEVIGIDVGHDQTAQEVLDAKDFYLIEGLNVKNLPEHFYFKSKENYYDLVMSDVSFMSVLHFIELMLKFLKPSGELLLLIKPQFELGAKALNSKGIVKNDEDYKLLADKFFKLCEDLGLKSPKYIESSLKGKQGNKEFFLYAKK